MARLVGFVLLVLGVYLGASIATQGVDETLAPLLGREESAGEDDAASSSPAPRAARRAAGQAAPSAVTSRVRDRVTGALAEGARRHGGE
jgi:hypothetical protein